MVRLANSWARSRVWTRPHAFCAAQGSPSHPTPEPQNVHCETSRTSCLGLAQSPSPSSSLALACPASPPFDLRAPLTFPLNPPFPPLIIWRLNGLPGRLRQDTKNKPAESLASLHPPLHAFSSSDSCVSGFRIIYFRYYLLLTRPATYRQGPAHSPLPPDFGPSALNQRFRRSWSCRQTAGTLASATTQGHGVNSQTLDSPSFACVFPFLLSTFSLQSGFRTSKCRPLPKSHPHQPPLFHMYHLSPTIALTQLEATRQLKILTLPMMLVLRLLSCHFAELRLTLN